MFYHTVKFTNCTRSTGGGKIPVRLRHNQNYSLNVNFAMLEWTDEELKDYLSLFTENSIIPSSETKIIRKKSKY